MWLGRGRASHITPKICVGEIPQKVGESPTRKSPGASSKEDTDRAAKPPPISRAKSPRSPRLSVAHSRSAVARYLPAPPRRVPPQTAPKRRPEPICRRPLPQHPRPARPRASTSPPPRHSPPQTAPPSPLPARARAAPASPSAPPATSQPRPAPPLHEPSYAPLPIRVMHVYCPFVGHQPAAET